MDFIQTSNKQIDKFGVGKHGFSPGNPTLGVLATYFSNIWADGVQQELIALIEAAGLVPTSGDLAQVLKALRTPGVIKGLSRYIANGSWTAPLNVSTAYISGCAGGGGGGGGGGTGGQASNWGAGGGAGGGAGQSAIRVPIIVVPGTTYAISIGAAGSGAATKATANGSPGVSGGTTSFAALLSLAGGGGGFAGNQAQVNASGPGADPSTGYPGGGGGQDGAFAGNGGTGGAGPFGGGGAPGRAGISNGGDGQAGGGFGAGGGGGGGAWGSVGGPGGRGGNGTAGSLYVEW